MRGAALRLLVGLACACLLAVACEGAEAGDAASDGDARPESSPDDGEAAGDAGSEVGDGAQGREAGEDDGGATDGDRSSDDAAGGPGAEEAADPGPVTVAFAGDVHGESRIRETLLAGGNPLDGVAPALEAADVAVVNLETAVGSGGTPQPKQFRFQAPEQLWDALTGSGVDIVSLANNHALDFGVDGLRETIAGAREAGLGVIGAGENPDEAYAPTVVDVGGRTVAVVGLTRVYPVPEWNAGEDRPGMAGAYDVHAAAAAVVAAAAEADHVVVMIHWGVEREACPVDHQRELADRLVGAGADVVAGHHPHVLQGVEERDGALVAYSLGNFVFYASGEEGRQTGILEVTLDGDGVAGWEFAPARIDDTGAPQLVEDEPARAILDVIADRSPGGGRCSFPEPS